MNQEYGVTEALIKRKGKRGFSLKYDNILFHHKADHTKSKTISWTCSSCGMNITTELKNWRDEGILLKVLTAKPHKDTCKAIGNADGGATVNVVTPDDAWDIARNAGGDNQTLDFDVPSYQSFMTQILDEVDSTQQETDKTQSMVEEDGGVGSTQEETDKTQPMEEERNEGGVNSTQEGTDKTQSMDAEGIEGGVVSTQERTDKTQPMEAEEKENGVHSTQQETNKTQSMMGEEGMEGGVETTQEGTDKTPPMENEGHGSMDDESFHTCFSNVPPRKRQHDSPSNDSEPKRTNTDFGVSFLDLTPQSSYIEDPFIHHLTAQTFVKEMQQKLWNFLGFLCYYIVNRKKFIEAAKKAQSDAERAMKESNEKGISKQLNQEEITKLNVKNMIEKMRNLRGLDLWLEDDWDEKLESYKADEKCVVKLDDILKNLYDNIIPNHEVVNEAIKDLMKVDASWLRRIAIGVEKKSFVEDYTTTWIERAKEYFKSEHGMKEVVDKLYELIQAMEDLRSIIEAVNDRRNELFCKITEGQKLSKINKHINEDLLKAEQLLNKSRYYSAIIPSGAPSNPPTYKPSEFINIEIEALVVSNAMENISNFIEWDLLKLRRIMDKAMRADFNI